MFRLRGCYPLCRLFPKSSTTSWISDSSRIRQNPQNGPTTPYSQRLPAITRIRFSLFHFRSPLLAESLLFSLPVGTEMFHFPTFPPHALCVQAWVTGHDSSWVSPFGHPRITARLTAPRGLSQPPTSFIGSQCQGIHHAPLNTYNTKQTKKNEKKESHYNKPHQPTLTKNHPPKETAPPEPATSCGLMLATTIHKSNTTPHHQAGRQSEPPTNSQGPAPTTPKKPGGEPAGLLPQDPTVCSATPAPRSRRPGDTPRNRDAPQCLLCTHQNPTTGPWHLSQPPDPTRLRGRGNLFGIGTP